MAGPEQDAAAEENTVRSSQTGRLVCVAGDDQGRTFRVTDSALILGRGDSDVSLSAGDVSRTHAKLTASGEGVFIEDLGSLNGTVVNDVKIHGRMRLQPGDRIQLGSTILVFTYYDELEERVRQLHKLEAMTAAVSGLAHDFNNAVQIILCGLDQLDRASMSEEGRTAITDMKNAATSAASLATRLTKLGRGSQTSFEAFPLAPVVEESVRMTSRMIEKQIKVAVSSDSRAVVRGSREELQQVLVNLILNARDAISHHGEIRVECVLASLDRAAALARHLPTPREHGRGEYVQITVKDNGCGMDEATLARAFEPFFTTKAPDKGTGLGLAMVHSIVRRHSGTVDIESRPGMGTSIRLLIPAAVA